MARMRATGGSPGGAAALVTVCWVALALALCAAPARAQDVLSDAAREVATCGSCTWFVVGGSPGALVKNGTCEADCSGNLYLYGQGIGTISEGAFAGLPLLEGLGLFGINLQQIHAQTFSHLPMLEWLDLDGNKLQHVPAQAFSRLPMLRELWLEGNPLVGLEPGTFANNTALQYLRVGGTALACVPADGIPDTATIYGAARCPAGCEVGTVYDAAADACVACPAGLQPAVPGTVGGALATCVPAGWDAVLLAGCGSCLFWRTAATNVLVRTGSCEVDCSYLYLSRKGIAAVAPGVFANLTGLEGLYITGNPLGCVPGVPDGVSIHSGVPRCPANCTAGTTFVQPSNACPTAGDGICDEPVWCEAGTDCADCQDVLGYATCDGSAGVCLPCPAGLTTAGVGAGGAESCVDPAALASGETTSSSAVATSPAPTPSPSPCTSGARLFSVAGIALCVPDRFFPAPSVEHCVLDKTWADVKADRSAFAVGGLGRKLMPEWKVWMCAADLACSAREGDRVCFTFSERHEVFVPWGYNNDLKIVKV